MTVRVLEGDCRDVLKTLPDESVHCVVTSPPYWGLRDYGVLDQIGLEPTPQAFVAELVQTFAEVRRVLRSDGTLWLNLGDSYARAQETNVPQTRNQAHGYPKHSKAGSSDGAVGRADRPGGRVAAMGLKPKDLVGVPWRVALALQEAGWWLRMDIIWSKPNPMPESVTDRPTKSHEYIFLLAKSERYYYNAAAIAEPAIHAGQTVTLGEKSLSKGQAAGINVAPSGNGNADSVIVGDTRNKRSVWTVTTKAYNEAHFATFPPDLIEPCILAGCPAGGTVLDPFGGAGTTGLVADRHQRSAILIELNPEYAAMAEKRIRGDSPLFADTATV
jgi:DNA modification methylase